MAKNKKKDGERDPDELAEENEGLRAIAEALGVDDVDKALDDIAYRKDGSPIWLGAPADPQGDEGGPEGGDGKEGGDEGAEGAGDATGDSEGPKPAGGSANGDNKGPVRARTRPRGALRGGGRTGGAAKPVKEMTDAEKAKHYREVVRPDIMGEEANA